VIRGVCATARFERAPETALVSQRERRGRRFDARHQHAMRAQLERLASTHLLSKDVYEIATRGLG
jgi:hypothetical protein